MFLGIDYGRKRVGIAIGEKIAFSRGFIINDQYLLGQIIEIIKEDNVKAVIIGWPTKDSGKDGELVEEIKVLGEKIKSEVDVEIVFEEESDTTFVAHHLLKEAGLGISESKSQVDALAAATILQQYLDQRNKKIK